ncbi:MAG: SIMPL domain-containing protein [Acidobacteriaceae bacterium]
MKFHPDRRTMGVLVSACCLVAASAYPQQIQVNKNNRTLAITASDAASAMADTATVHIGFVVYAPDAQAAYAKGSAASNAIAKAVLGMGIDKDAFQSESQNISETPQFELEKLPPAEQAQRKFQLRQSWTVKTNAGNAAKVLNAAVNAGANQSGQIDWSVADEDALQAKAAGKALARARTIASQMAQGLGIKLGDLIYASNQAPEPAPHPMMMRSMLAGAGETPAPAPLAMSPQKVERSATVYAVFSIE